MYRAPYEHNAYSTYTGFRQESVKWMSCQRCPWCTITTSRRRSLARSVTNHICPLARCWVCLPVAKSKSQSKFCSLKIRWIFMQQTTVSTRCSKALSKLVENVSKTKKTKNCFTSRNNLGLFTLHAYLYHLYRKCADYDQWATLHQPTTRPFNLDPKSTLYTFYLQLHYVK